MKKLNKKLQLNKVTIARLTSDQQRSMYGGDLPTTVTKYDCGGGGITVFTNPTCNGATCGCQGIQTEGTCDSAACPPTSPERCASALGCTQNGQCNDGSSRCSIDICMF